MPNQLASLIKDQNGTSVQIGSSFKTSDGAGTPVNSPVTLASGVNVITVPEGAVECIFMPVTNDLKVSELALATTYDLVLKNSKESFPCARMDKIYIQGSTSDVVYFRFTDV